MTKRAVCSGVAALGCAFVWTGGLRAQFGRGAGDWMTAGIDAQRSSWIRTDGKISSAALQKPGFELLWKMKLDGGAKESFAAPMLLNSYIGYRGFRSLAYVGLSSNKVVAIDSDLGRIEWEKQLPGSAASGGCSGALTALTRPTTAPFPGAGGGRGFGGRGGAAKSAVGEAGEGSVILKQVAAAQAAAMDARGGRGAAQARGGGFPFQRTASLLNAFTGDGMLHTLLVSNGESYKPAVRFLPANSSARGLIVVDEVAYAASSKDCGTTADALIAIDLKSGEVAMWKPDSGVIAGSEGPAVGPDGTLYVATSAGELAAIEPKTLKVKSVYKAGQPFVSSPVIFEMKDKAMIAAATQGGRIHLFDAAGLDRAIATSEGIRLAAGALASWQDSGGGRWILGAGSGAITALKVSEDGGAPSLKAGWTSRDIASPTSPVIVNGVIFTASTGSAPGVLYALDAATGKDLWNSGKAIAGAIRGGGISVGNSQVYLATSDGTFYAFGFPMEH